MRAHLEDIADEDRQHGVVQAEDRRDGFHDAETENDRLRDDVRQSRFGFAQEIAPFLDGRRRRAHHQQRHDDGEKAQGIGVKSAGSPHDADGDAAERRAEQGGALP